MKLIADLPAVDVEEPPHRPVLAILGGAAVLVVMLGIAIALLMSDEGEEDDPAAAASSGDVAEAPEATVDLASWTAGVTVACQTAADEHPAFGQPGRASVAEFDAAVRGLTSAVRQIPLPTDTEPRATALTVVTMGDEAEQAWDSIAILDRDDVPQSELDDAVSLTQAFVTALVEVGADCDVLD